MRYTSVRNFLKLGYLIFMRDFMTRYRLTYFGFFWIFVKPILSALPLILVGKQFNLGGQEQGKIPYEVFAFVGFILWQIFWDSVVIPQWLIRRQRSLLSGLPVPREIVLMGSCFYIFLNLFFSMVTMLIMMVLYRVPFSLTMLLALTSLPLLVFSGLAIGVYLAPLTLIFLDLRYSLPILSGAILWTVPIIYAAPGEGPIGIINKFNPLTYLIGVPRSWFLNIISPNQWLFVLAVCFFIILFSYGLKFYRKVVSIAIDHMV